MLGQLQPAQSQQQGREWGCWEENNHPKVQSPGGSSLILQIRRRGEKERERKKEKEDLVAFPFFFFLFFFDIRGKWAPQGELHSTGSLVSAAPYRRDNWPQSNERPEEKRGKKRKRKEKEKRNI